MSLVRALARLPTRSGVTDAEIARVLPGDELIPHASEVLDRATTLPAPPERVWPWIAQLGKGRAGWYFPRRLERLLPWHGIRRLDPALGQVAVGDDVPDWGPGDPVLRVMSVDPPRALSYLSLRDRADHHRWPRDESAVTVFAISWTLALDPVPAGTRLHLRLRMRVKHPALARVGGVFDWLTVVLLFRGLRERLEDEA